MGEGLGLWLTKQIKKLRSNETKELDEIPLKFGKQPLLIDVTNFPCRKEYC